MKKKVMRTYRLNAFIYDELKKITQELGITETSFIEMAIVEKILKIEQSKNNVKGE